MSGAILQGFVYGEDRDGPRSLGFKLLAPAAAPWAGAVEVLARKLQAGPYPETWKPADLFCSVLLEDGQRLVALARYGLRDHSANPRPGGLELLGGVGPATIDVPQARAVVAWLAQRRRDVDDPRGLAGAIALDALPAAPPLPAHAMGMACARLGDAGALLLTGATPDQPDEQLGLLERSTPPRWQWLPYCGPDFPFDAYAQRGPLIAWLPPRIDIALLLTRPRADAAPAAAPAHLPLGWIVAAALLLLAVFNIWAWLALPGRLPAPAPPAPPVVAPKTATESPPPTQAREHFAQALHRLVAGRSGGKLLNEEGLRAVYDHLVAADPELRCEDPQGQAMVALVSQLVEFDPERVGRIIVEEFGDKKGYDPEVVRLISERVRLRLLRELKVGK
jgi:hypothetical protein